LEGGLIFRIEVRDDELPSEVRTLAEEKRRVLIETLADVDDVIADRFLMEEEPTIEEINVCILIHSICSNFRLPFVVLQLH